MKDFKEIVILLDSNKFLTMKKRNNKKVKIKNKKFNHSSTMISLPVDGSL